MNEPPDPLERELAALRPHELSPALRQRIAGSLADSLPSRSRRVWGMALAGGLAAACLAAILLGRRVAPGPEQGPIAVHVSPPPRPGSADVLPTPGPYQHALARSPDELDALLDQLAVRTSQSNRAGAQIHAFAHSAAEIRDLIGEP